MTKTEFNDWSTFHFVDDHEVLARIDACAIHAAMQLVRLRFPEDPPADNHHCALFINAAEQTAEWDGIERHASTSLSAWVMWCGFIGKPYPEEGGSFHRTSYVSGLAIRDLFSEFSKEPPHAR